MFAELYYALTMKNWFNFRGNSKPLRPHPQCGNLINSSINFACFIWPPCKHPNNRFQRTRNEKKDAEEFLRLSAVGPEIRTPSEMDYVWIVFNSIPDDRAPIRRALTGKNPKPPGVIRCFDNLHRNTAEYVKHRKSGRRRRRRRRPATSIHIIETARNCWRRSRSFPPSNLHKFDIYWLVWNSGNWSGIALIFWFSSSAEIAFQFHRLNCKSSRDDA